MFLYYCQRVTLTPSLPNTYAKRMCGYKAVTTIL